MVRDDNVLCFKIYEKFVFLPIFGPVLYQRGSWYVRFTATSDLDCAPLFSTFVCLLFKGFLVKRMETKGSYGKQILLGT